MYILWKQTALCNVVIHTSLLNTQQRDHFTRTGIASAFIPPQNKWQIWTTVRESHAEIAGGREGASALPTAKIVSKLLLLQFSQAGNQTKDR